jgi:membrane-associated protease RseP (regulator of RpoE activity)
MRNIKIHLLLFVLTAFSTLIAGSYFIAEYNLLSEFPKHLLHGLAVGVPFAMPLMLILGGHEMAHYVNSRRHKVIATLPYFIPFPNLFGTLGAVIKMKSRIRDKSALIDIGASGPIVGFILSVAVCSIGLSMSHVVPAHAPAPGKTVLGGSLLYNCLMSIFLKGDLHTHAVDLHPVAVAGWVGLFVTSINLMPVGQLDGGHVAYAFFPKRHRLISKIFIVALIVMGLGFPGWLIWGMLLLFVLGTKHPPVENPNEPLDWKRRAIGILSFVIFIITFTPIPIIIAP